MNRPFFTVAIPTKNRPDRVGNAARSVLEQTFEGFEVIVCDNSDEAEAEATAAIVDELGDPRVRYVRTSGRLSMPDNWERAIEEARGEYVGILTDRSVFRHDAMQVVHDEIAGSGAQLVTWFNDLYGKGASGKEFKRRACTLKRYRHSSETILDYFLHGNPKYSTKVIPKLMTSFCSRATLDEIRSGPVGRCCPPVAPDFTSGFLMLAHCEWVLTLDECLYVSCGAGNGSDFRRGGELADRFRRDLGMEWHEIVDRMPSDACFSHALVLNDLMRVRDAIPDRLPNVEIDRVQYYMGCLIDFVKAAQHGARRDDDLDALLAALEQEPPQISDRVRQTRLFATAATPDGVRAKLEAKASGERSAPAPEFDTVFEAMEWDAANPREAAATSLVELGFGLDQLLDKSRAQPARPKKQRAPKPPRPPVDPAVAAAAAAEKARLRAAKRAAKAPVRGRREQVRARLRGLLDRARTP